MENDQQTVESSAKILDNPTPGDPNGVEFVDVSKAANGASKIKIGKPSKSPALESTDQQEAAPAVLGHVAPVNVVPDPALREVTSFTGGMPVNLNARVAADPVIEDASHVFIINEHGDTMPAKQIPGSGSLIKYPPPANVNVKVESTEKPDGSAPSLVLK